MPFRHVFVYAVGLLMVAGVAGAAAPAQGDWQALFIGGVRAGQEKNLAKAEQMLMQAVEASVQFPPEDPRVATTYNTLGLVYEDEKKYAEAEKVFDRALGIYEKAYGPDSLDVGNIDFNIATVAMAQGHYDAALPYIQKIRPIYLKILGPDSLKTVSTLCMEGEAYMNLKKYGDAEGPLKSCADAREASGGVENADLGDALYDLGLVYQHEGNLTRADSSLQLAEKIREKTLGVTSSGFADALEAHAAVLRQMGRPQDAERDETVAAAIRRHEKK